MPTEEESRKETAIQQALVASAKLQMEIMKGLEQGAEEWTKGYAVRFGKPLQYVAIVYGKAMIFTGLELVAGVMGLSEEGLRTVIASTMNQISDLKTAEMAKGKTDVNNISSSVNGHSGSSSPGPGSDGSRPG